LAAEITEAFADETSHGPTELQLYAAQVIAEDSDGRGCDLMAGMAKDPRRDIQTRLMCARRLDIFDEARAQDLLAELLRDPATCDTLGIAHVLMLRSTEARTILDKRIRNASTRAGAVQALLQLDPDHAVRLLLALAEGDDPADRRWARDELSAALRALEITASG
jgi:hypothetical protein